MVMSWIWVFLEYCDVITDTHSFSEFRWWEGNLQGGQPTFGATNCNFNEFPPYLTRSTHGLDENYDIFASINESHVLLCYICAQIEAVTHLCLMALHSPTKKNTKTGRVNKACILHAHPCIYYKTYIKIICKLCSNFLPYLQCWEMTDIWVCVL